MAIFNTFGCIQSVPKIANNAGMIIWYGLIIMLLIFDIMVLISQI